MDKKCSALLLLALVQLSAAALPLSLIAAALAPVPPGGKLWVLLVAGSSGYTNYRHQADVMHAYQVMHARGVPDEQIVVMVYDDVVKSFFNTRKGQMYNEPNGPDVYEGVPKDYTNKHITPKNFLAVLRGDAAAMQSVPGTGRVIDSGPNDRIFVYFADHGAPGMLAFPSKFVVVPTKLLARDLISTIEDMHAHNKYSQMLLYIEACESGSMFSGLLKPTLGVLAVTAASPSEPSYACYYNNTIGTFLGDCFSNHWLEHEDDTFTPSPSAPESIEQNAYTIQQATNTSHVCIYGDPSVAALPAATFFGGDSPATRHSAASAHSRVDKRAGERGAVSSRDVALTVLRRQTAYLQEQLAATSLSGDEQHSAVLVKRLQRVQSMLVAEEAMIYKSAAIFGAIVADLAGNDMAAREALLSPPASGTCDVKAVTHFDCLGSTVESYERACGVFSDYSLQYAGVLQRACDSGHSTGSIEVAIERACVHESPISRNHHTLQQDEQGEEEEGEEEETEEEEGEEEETELKTAYPSWLQVERGKVAHGNGHAKRTGGSVRHGGAGCKTSTDEASCMAISTCTWCKCAAVPSKCYSRKQAAKLPPAIFTCDP